MSRAIYINRLAVLNRELDTLNKKIDMNIEAIVGIEELSVISTADQKILNTLTGWVELYRGDRQDLRSRIRDAELKLKEF